MDYDTYDPHVDVDISVKFADMHTYGLLADSDTHDKLANIDIIDPPENVDFYL